MAEQGGLLKVVILEAKNLAAKDKGGTSDPFVQLSVGGSKFGTTEVIKKTLNPTWNETFSKQDVPEDDALTLTMYDKDSFGSKDFMGIITIPLSSFAGTGLTNKWYTLEKRKSKDEVSGEIHVSIEFVTSSAAEQSGTSDSGSSTGRTKKRHRKSSKAKHSKKDETESKSESRSHRSTGSSKELKALKKKYDALKLEHDSVTVKIQEVLASAQEGEVDTGGKLSVTVVEAKDLPKTDLIGKIDPFASVTVEGVKQKTEHIKKTYAPVWNADFDFHVKSTFSNIDIFVYDYDKLNKNDKVGKVSIPVFRVAKEGTYDDWLDLEPVKEGKKVKGSIHIKLTYTSNAPIITNTTDIIALISKYRDDASNRTAALEKLLKTKESEFDAKIKELMKNHADEIAKLTQESKDALAKQAQSVEDTRKSLVEDLKKKDGEIAQIRADFKAKLQSGDSASQHLVDEAEAVVAKVKDLFEPDYNKYCNPNRIGSLMARVISAKNLKKMDTFGKSDPYARITVEGDKRKTEIIKKSLKPVWEQEFHFDITSEASVIEATVLDYDEVGKNEEIGTITIPLTTVIHGKDAALPAQWYTLKYKNKEKSRGEVQLAFVYTELKKDASAKKGDTSEQAPTAALSEVDNVLDHVKQVKKHYTDNITKLEDKIATTTKQLKSFTADYMEYCQPDALGIVSICLSRAKGIPKMDTLGKADPYVKFSIGKRDYKTKVDKNTLTPVWNQSFQYGLESEEGDLVLTVYDHDTAGKDDVIGTVTFKNEDLMKGNAIEGWQTITGKKCKKAELYLTLQFQKAAEAKNKNTSGGSVSQLMDQALEVHNFLKLKYNEQQDIISDLMKSFDHGMTILQTEFGEPDKDAPLMDFKKRMALSVEVASNVRAALQKEIVEYRKNLDDSIKKLGDAFTPEYFEFCRPGSVGTLSVKVVEARNLAKKDVLGKSDPYVDVDVEGLVVTTKVKKNTLNPRWDEEFFMDVRDEKSEVVVNVSDWDAVGKADLMGTFKVNLADVIADAAKYDDIWIPLTGKKAKGDVHIRFKYGKVEEPVPAAPKADASAPAIAQDASDSKDDAEDSTTSQDAKPDDAAKDSSDVGDIELPPIKDEGDEGEDAQEKVEDIILPDTDDSKQEETGDDAGDKPEEGGEEGGEEGEEENKPEEQTDTAPADGDPGYKDIDLSGASTEDKEGTEDGEGGDAAPTDADKKEDEDAQPDVAPSDADAVQTDATDTGDADGDADDTKPSDNDASDVGDASQKKADADTDADADTSSKQKKTKAPGLKVAPSVAPSETKTRKKYPTPKSMDQALQQANQVKIYFDKRITELQDDVSRAISTLDVTFSKDYYKYCRPDTIGVLHIKVVEAQALPKMDLIGHTDAFVSLKCEDSIKKTKTIDNKRDPVWNELFAFELRQTGSNFTFEVWDEDAVGKDELFGRVVVPLQDFVQTGNGDKWYDITLLKKKSSKKSPKLHIVFDYNKIDKKKGAAAVSHLHDLLEQSSTVRNFYRDTLKDLREDMTKVSKTLSDSIGESLPIGSLCVKVLDKVNIPPSISAFVVISFGPQRYRCPEHNMAVWNYTMKKSDVGETLLIEVFDESAEHVTLIGKTTFAASSLVKGQGTGKKWWTIKELNSNDVMIQVDISFDTYTKQKTLPVVPAEDESSKSKKKKSDEPEEIDIIPEDEPETILPPDAKSILYLTKCAKDDLHEAVEGSTIVKNMLEHQLKSQKESFDSERKAMESTLTAAIENSKSIISRAKGLQKEVSAMASQAPCSLTVAVVGARDLKTDFFGSVDPFVRLTLNNSKFETKMVNATKNPTWKEEFNFVVPNLHAATSTQSLHVAAWDHNMLRSDDFIGSTSVMLTKEYLNGEMHEFEVELSGRDGDVMDKKTGKKVILGFVLLRMRFTDSGMKYASKLMGKLVQSKV